MKIHFSSKKITGIVGNIGYLTLERFVRLGLTLVIGVLVARHLGPSEFGKFSYVLTFVVILEAISGLGLDNIIVQRIVQQKNEHHQILFAGLILRIISLIILIPIGGVIIYFLREDEAIHAISYIMLSSLVFRSVDVIDFWFQAQVKPKYVVYTKLISFSTYAILRLLIVFFGFGLVQLAYAFLFEGVIRTILLVYMYIRKSEAIRIPKFKLDVAKALLSRSWPLLFSAITVMIYMKIDVLMLGSMTTDLETGLYSSAVRVSEMFYNLPVIVMMAVFPFLVKLKLENIEKFHSALKVLYGLISPSMLILAITVTFSSDQIVGLLFGVSYRGASDILVVHIWSGLFIAFSVIRGKWLIVENLERYTFYCQLSGAICNVILNLVLIPRFGGLGCAYATLISYATASTLMSAIFSKLRSDFRMQINSLFPYYLVKVIGNYFNQSSRV